MFDSPYLGAWDLPQGEDRIVTITKVVGEELMSNRGKDKKPVAYIEESDRGLVLNKTNARTIAALYTNDTNKWIGQRITLYRTTVQVGPEVKDCIRVRPDRPADEVKK